MSLLDDIGALLAPHGLIPRGGFTLESPAPPGPSGKPARAVVLVGHGGASHWPHFRAWRATQPPDLADPLDAWSKEVIGAVAERLGARAAFPSDRPYLPFGQWAMRAEGLRPSPLGVLMHPRFGLWHAYRGALLFDGPLVAEPPGSAPHLCDLCREKPCLKACPIGAHTADGFRYGECRAFVRSPAGDLQREGGCLDRNACPVGTEYRYPADMQAFHMAAFAGV